MATETQIKCAECGKMDRPPRTDRYKDEIDIAQAKHACCRECAYWFACIDSVPAMLVIDGRVYAVGREDARGMRGFGGRRFDIEYLDGRRVSSTNLWNGSQVSERFRSRLPDNARFLGGAGAVQVGDTTCWESSR